MAYRPLAVWTLVFLVRRMSPRRGGGNWNANADIWNASEAAFQEQVLALARLYQWRCYHTHDSRRSQPGFPDLVMVRSRRLIFAELKTEKGRLSRAQGEWLADLENVAAEVYVWRPPDLQRIAETLAGAGIDPEIGRAYVRERMP